MLKWIQGGISAVTGIAEPEYGKDYIQTSTERVENEKKQPFRELARDELDWLKPDHTNVETVTFYFSNLETGILGFAQVIHSNIVGLHTQAQFTFRIYNSHQPGDLNVWTSTKLENFRIEGPNFYADDLSVELNEEGTSYVIKSNVNEISIVDLTVTRLTKGVKVGDDPVTYFGDNIEEPWGTMRHVFWPRNKVTGIIKVKKEKSKESGDEESTNEGVSEDNEDEGEESGEDDDDEDDDEESEEESSDDDDDDESEEEPIEYEEVEIVFTEKDPVYSLFIMAFQGMKPHHAAKAWNFLNFHSEENSAVLIEFITPKSYANTKVSIGIVTSKDDILSVTVNNDFKHLNAEVDSIGWKVPKNLCIEFNGVASTVTDEEIENEEVKDEHKVNVVVETPLKKLVERVDVMNEIPQFVKNIVSGIAGTKPYIYQFADDEEFTIQLNGGEKQRGLGWTEVTFISESDVITEESYNEE
ncbi:hypothetical protein Kpol_365p11 [Vanderwaltozyma polyspora DSM 70294]|uniref:Survival factor 1 n=1 Tax=Vanderwaltozyma polyspora (strain ATCC 22028 / DSM 70294 / BCRC 21397 / CBS 2163 / NBRC 10782 / NRRL Y-8283 / UCD 57-17) TaxID=436907 RepID=A7TS08_VANPO|nr:uncharacterized protein Kpol_365p11 [Vanderwaltozyma polyspora DSM 70294]EDO14955.1 hypothetical protein Kpol_365p11 [Vanderwaltozyma polyspora DSM 70294]